MRTLSFYGVHGPYGCFSNFSPHGFELHGEHWPTSEHYFQAQKFGGEWADAIRRAKSPMAAKRMGQSRKHPLRSDWERVKEDIMSAALEAKFSTHEELRETLLSTGDARIVENAPHDSYWGAGPDGRGKNRLGVLLMRLRDRLIPGLACVEHRAAAPRTAARSGEHRGARPHRAPHNRARD